MGTELYMTPALPNCGSATVPRLNCKNGRITACHLSTWHQHPMSSYACIPSPMIAGSMESTSTTRSSPSMTSAGPTRLFSGYTSLTSCKGWQLRSPRWPDPAAPTVAKSHAELRYSFRALNAVRSAPLLLGVTHSYGQMMDVQPSWGKARRLLVSR